MSQRPTAQQLLEAAREHLATRVLPAIADAPTRFQTLVAAHVLGVVEREIALGESLALRDWTNLCALLGHDEPRPMGAIALRDRVTALEAELCAAIRAGRFDDDTAATARALRGQLADDLEGALQIWNPAFLARVTR